MARSKGVILVQKLPKSEEKLAVLKREVAQIHANAVIRLLSAENADKTQMRQMIKALTADITEEQSR